MDDELDETPIVEDESDLSASEAIVNAIQSYLEENSSTTDTDSEDSSNQSGDEKNDQENSGEAQNGDESSEGQSSTPSGEPVGENQDSNKTKGENQENSEDGGDEEGGKDDDAEDGGDDEGEGKDGKKGSKAKKAAKEKARQQRVGERKKKRLDDHKKQLVGPTGKIAQNFMRPTSIPQDIGESLKDSGKAIMETSKKAMTDPEAKPKEKTEEVADVTKETFKTAPVKIIFETVGKFFRELIKRAYTTFPYPGAPLWAATIVVIKFLIVFIILMAILFALSSSTAAAAASTEAEYMTTNYCITTEHFYGLRTAYIDEDLLSDALELSYKQYVIDILEDIKSTDGISITISLPEITEETPFTNAVPVDGNITTMSLGIAKIAAGKDASDSVNSFADLYNEISYFGLTDDQVEDADEFITKYLTDHSIVNKGETDLTISGLVDTAIENLTYIKNLCEKVMIKDYVADELGLEDIEQLTYVGSVYMPHSTLTLTTITTAVTTTTPETPVVTNLIHQKGGTISTLDSGETGKDDGKCIIYSSFDENYQLEQFTTFDSTNPESLIDGVSLFEVLRLGSINGVDYSSFFKKEKNDENIEVYTWKPECENFLYYTFESTGKFIFNDLVFSCDPAA